MPHTFVSPIEVKLARLKAGLKQYELARRIGLPPPRLSEIESGRRPLTPEIERRIWLELERCGSLRIDSATGGVPEEGST